MIASQINWRFVQKHVIHSPSTAAQGKPRPESKLEALERFVVDNDELLVLEEQIGRFNIFDALRIVDREVKHSDFLAWLLDPNESHG